MKKQVSLLVWHKNRAVAIGSVAVNYGQRVTSFLREKPLDQLLEKCNGFAK